jgi:hypothetical protein
MSTAAPLRAPFPYVGGKSRVAGCGGMWRDVAGCGGQSDGAGRENAARERIWFSPHCLKVRRERQRPLFAGDAP